MTTSVSTRAPGTLNPTRQQLDELDALLQRMLELPVDKLDEPEQAESEGPADEPPPPVTNLGERPATPPVSYMVVETASPRPLPPASGFEPRPSVLAPRLVPVTATGETLVPPPEVGQVSNLPAGFQPAPPPVKASGEGEMWVPLRSTWQPSAQTWQPLAESWHQANGGTPPPDAMPSLIPSPRLDLSPPLVGAASRAAPGVRLGSPDLPPPRTNEASIPAASAPAPTIAEPRLSLAAEDAPVAVPGPLLPLLWFNQGFDACLAPLGAPGRWLCGRGRPVLGLIGLACLAAAVAVAVSSGMGWTW